MTSTRSVVGPSGRLQFGTLSYDRSQAEGLAAINAAIDAADSGSPIVVMGYSASAGVIVQELRALESRAGQGLPVPDPATQFHHLRKPEPAEPGILNRLPGLFPPRWSRSMGPRRSPTIGPSTSAGNTTRSPIFPNQPFSLLADLNALVVRDPPIFYYDVDLTDTSSYASDVTIGDTRYVTLRREHLPLLEPLYKWLPSHAGSRRCGTGLGYMHGRSRLRPHRRSRRLDSR